MTRLPVKKTYKLFIGGAFPRSESGRTYEAQGANVARASRKDVRDAVQAARGAQPKWGSATAYNRGQVLYRIAEMMEDRRIALAAVSAGNTEVDRAIDRVVWYAGWADKLAQVLGGANPVAGPYFNFTIPEPTGRSMEFSGVNVFRFHDGKVVEIWNHRDDLGLMQQLGAPVYAGAAE